MGLTVSGADAPSGYEAHPDHKLDIALAGAAIQVILNGEVIASSDRALRMTESRRAPLYYFPRDCVNMSFLEKTDLQTTCPFKGAASYWTVKVGDRREVDAAWSYEDPLRQVAGIQNYMAFYWDKMDQWLRDGRPIGSHST